jgi:hypothetical protein
MRLGVSNHAVERYVERVKPQLGEAQAREELEALSELCEQTQKPRWFLGESESDYYLKIGPEAVAAVRDRCITTVVTPEIVRQHHRQAVNRYKARLRHRRGMKRKEFKKRNKRPEREAA